MTDDNKQNLHYFEAASMRGLFEQLERWQNETRKRLLSTSIHHDRDRYCCIALTNPAEVMLVDVSGEPVYVYGNALQVQESNQVDVSLVDAIPLEVEIVNVLPLSVEIG